MPSKTVYDWLKQILLAALMVLALSLVLDWWRKPAQPPGFARQTLVTVHGKTLTLAEFSQGRAVVVYFWGSWCGICRHTSPTINRLHQAGVPVLGVAWQSGTATSVAAYLRKHQWDFDTVNDHDGAVVRQWQIKAVPTVVLLKNGQMVHNTSGLSSYWGLRIRLWLARWQSPHTMLPRALPARQTQ